MSKQLWKPGNMVYPLPVVMVSCGDRDGHINVLTAAWTGTICSDPAMVYVSIRKSRWSHHMISQTREFVINLTTEELAYATDYVGVKSGAQVDKFKEMHLTPVYGTLKYAPMIEESPVCIECKVEHIMELGSHDMFIATVTAVHADEAYMDENGRFHLDQAHPLVYSHGQYYSIGKHIGKFGYSVQKKNKRNSRKKRLNKQHDCQNKKCAIKITSDIQ